MPDDGDIFDRQKAAVVYAEAEIVGVTHAVLVEQAREGVELPDGFAERIAAAIGRRSHAALERLAFQSFTVGVDRGEAIATDPDAETDEVSAG